MLHRAQPGGFGEPLRFARVGEVGELEERTTALLWGGRVEGTGLRIGTMLIWGWSEGCGWVEGDGGAEERGSGVAEIGSHHGCFALRNVFEVVVKLR